MRKYFITSLVALGLISFTPNANAQGFLKKLKDKAVEKVKEQVNQKIGGKAATTTVGTTQAAQDGDYAVESEEETDYIASLMNLNKEKAELISTTPPDGQNVAAKTFSQVLASRPAPFDGALLLTDAGVEKIQNAKEAVDVAIYGLQVGNLQNSKAASQNAQAQAGLSKANSARAAIGQEVMAAAKARGIDMTKATEAQILDVTASVIGKKLGVPVADMKKIYAMNPSEAKAYIRKNYPAAEQKAIALGIGDDGGSDGEVNSGAAKIFEELQALNEKVHGSYEQLGNNMMAYAEKLQAGLQNGEEVDFDDNPLFAQANKLAKQVDALRKKYAAEWIGSDAYNRVKALHEQNSARANEFREQNPDANRLPQWWVDTQKEMNTIIRDWNAKQASKFAAELKDVGKDDLVYLQQVAKLDDRLNALQKDAYFVQAKSVVMQFHSDLTNYVHVPFYILDCPLLDSVSEDPNIEFGGKG